VELPKGLQWVQIDLEAEYVIYAILFWHHWLPMAFQDVVVQVSEDQEFKQGVQTLFNNDYDNSRGLGKGTDKQYPEHYAGKLIDAKGVKARYARFYSNGSLYFRWNAYQEIEIYGLPVLELVPLPLHLPLIIPNDGHFDMPKGPNIEPLPDWQKPRPPFLAPKGVTNLALHKKVTTSAPKVYGTLARITDGKKEVFIGLGTNGFEAKDGVELPKGLQWVQVDLEKDYPIYAVVFWHNCDVYTALFHDVIVQASPDPEFKQNVQTLFNNDHDNSAGFGKGTDKEYPEWHEGKLINTKGIKARYWRFYSNGCIYTAWNQYLEIEIYGLSD
jgi:hypothetical protein